jgi:hypothetical protein
MYFSAVRRGHDYLYSEGIAMHAVVRKRLHQLKGSHAFSTLELEERRRRYLLIWCSVIGLVPLWCFTFVGLYLGNRLEALIELLAAFWMGVCLAKA